MLSVISELKTSVSSVFLHPIPGSSSLVNADPSFCLSLCLTFGARVRGRRWRASSTGSLFSSVCAGHRDSSLLHVRPVWTQPHFLPDRSEGWERLRDPSGEVEMGVVGHLVESMEAPGHSYSTVNEVTSRPLWGWKHCTPWEASFNRLMWK